MASFNLYTGNGSQTNYPLTFQYLLKEHVHVKVAGSEVTNWSWLDSSTIQFDAAPSLGEVVDIRRRTPTGRLAVFTNGEVLLDAELNIAVLQAMYIAEEATDLVSVDSQAAAQAAEAFKDQAAAAAIVAEGHKDAAQVARVGAEDARDEALSLAETFDSIHLLRKDDNLLSLVNKVEARFNLGISAVGNTGQWVDILGKPMFGTAATVNYGSGAYQLVQRDVNGRIPNLDTDGLAVFRGGARLVHPSSATYLSFNEADSAYISWTGSGFVVVGGNINISGSGWVWNDTYHPQVVSHVRLVAAGSFAEGTSISGAVVTSVGSGAIQLAYLQVLINGAWYSAGYS